MWDLWSLGWLGFTEYPACTARQLAIRAMGMAVALFANSLVSAGLAAVFMTVVEPIGYGGAVLIPLFLRAVGSVGSGIPVARNQGPLA